MDISELLDAEGLIAIARTDSKDRKLGEAPTRLTIARSKPSCPAETRALLGDVFTRLGLFTHTQTDCAKILAPSPDSHHEQSALGIACRSDGSSALRRWRDVPERKRGHPPALFFQNLVQPGGEPVTDTGNSFNTLASMHGDENSYVKRVRAVPGEQPETSAKAVVAH